MIYVVNYKKVKRAVDIKKNIRFKGFSVDFTSVLAQLQLIAVHRNIFINNMMRNKIPKVIASQRSQGGRIPSSQYDAISVIGRKSHGSIYT